MIVLFLLFFCFCFVFCFFWVGESVRLLKVLSFKYSDYDISH
jgi:hypothetical protein